MIISIIIFILSLLLIIRGATLATKYSSRLAKNLKLKKHVVGFIIVAFISILPEMFISINSALNGIPEFGLGTLFGSNVADLTLIFGILILFDGYGIKIKSNILKNVKIYPLFLLFPAILGLNGYYSRLDGLLLIIAGVTFYYIIFKNNKNTSDIERGTSNWIKNLLMLILSMTILLLGANLVVTSATHVATQLKISPIIVGLIIVSLGTTMPELFYSIQAIKKKDDDLAIGDILGSVLADATIVVGILAFIDPFYFPIKIIYITCVFMIISSLVLLKFMHSGKILSKKEGYLLLVFWMCYIIIEFLINK